MAELATFAEQFPEEAQYIEQAITLRRLALEEFDRLIRERPIASPLLRLKQLAATPLKPTEAAQKVLDVLDGLDPETAKRVLQLAAGCRTNQATRQSPPTGM